MHRSFDYSIEAWPGLVRIHCRYDTVAQQTIELSPEQVPAFIRALKEQAKAAVDLGEREEEHQRAASSGRAFESHFKG